MSAPAPKPFSLQSPEHIAQEYGGNKQKIAQAVQMGIIDSTSGLMAGMFIDRMRSAQAQEQAPQQTVAQKVLGPRPSQMPPQGGLGGLPPGGPQGAPPMQMASAAPPPGAPAPQGPVGMGAGGLTTLPLPDDMYDEHTFAGGGIVAFDGGGNTYDGLLAKATELEADANSGQHSELTNSYYRNQAAALRKKAADQQGVAQRNAQTLSKYAEPAWAARSRAINATPTANISLADSLQELPGYQYAFMNQGEIAAHDERIQPAIAAIQNIDKRLNTPASPPTALPATARPPAPAAASPALPGLGALAGKVATPAAAPRPTIADIARSAAKVKDTSAAAKPGLPTDAAAAPGVDPLDTYMKKFKEVVGDVPAPLGASDADKAARKKEDMWSALAQAGFGMMAGTSPNALTNIGEGFKAAMPTIQESLKQRRADEKEDKKAQYEYALAQQGLKGKQLDYAVGRVDKAEAAKQKADEDAENKRWHDLSIGEQRFETRARAGEAAAQLKQSALNNERMLVAQTPLATTYATNAVSMYKAKVGRDLKPGEEAQIYNKALDDLAIKQADAKGTQYAVANKNAIAMTQIGGPLAAEFAKSTNKQKYLMDLTDTLVRRTAGPSDTGVWGSARVVNPQ